jgi:alanine racemase
MLYQTVVRVHLEHIQHNIEGIRKAVGSERKILIAVKANAYGHGALEVAKMAQSIGVDWLGIATVPEGLALRQAGIQLPILKFGPTFPEEMAEAIRNVLTLAVTDLEGAKAMEQAAAALSMVAEVHLKVDTGMGRVGVPANDAAELAGFIDAQCPHLKLDGIFTHLPVSDDADPAYTREQIARFQSVVDEVNIRLGRTLSLAHCANSGAVLGHPEAWMDMVRPGIMIYGHYPDQGTPRSIDLKPGLSFITRISFLKKIKAGTSIGYGRTWIAPEDTYIATLPVGYADGYNRLFSNMGRVLIQGKSYPIVGRVCMDQCMVNVGPQTELHVGDEVVLIGRSGDVEISVEEWADKLGTITYEVTCQINSRVPRMADE